MGVTKRCSVEGCPKDAKKHGKCKQHGGGRRCSVEGCPKAAYGATDKRACSTAGGSGAACKGARNLPKVPPTSASGTAGAAGAACKGARKVPKVPPTSAASTAGGAVAACKGA
eukprot:1194318-Prorocentrum_minimum.AAC.3